MHIKVLDTAVQFHYKWGVENLNQESELNCVHVHVICYRCVKYDIFFFINKIYLKSLWQIKYKCYLNLIKPVYHATFNHRH